MADSLNLWIQQQHVTGWKVFLLGAYVALRYGLYRIQSANKKPEAVPVVGDPTLRNEPMSGTKNIAGLSALVILVADGLSAWKVVYADKHIGFEDLPTLFSLGPDAIALATQLTDIPAEIGDLQPDEVLELSATLAAHYGGAVLDDAVKNLIDQSFKFVAQGLAVLSAVEAITNPAVPAQA